MFTRLHVLFVMLGCTCGGTALSTAADPTTTPSTAEPTLRIAGPLIELRFQNSRGQLASLRDVPSRIELLKSTSDETGLWQIELRGAGKRRTLSPSDAKQFSSELPPGEPREIRLRWGGFAPGSGVISVAATVRLSADAPSSQWDLLVVKQTDTAVEKIRYPRFGALAKQEQERLAVPLWMGQLSAQPREALLPAGKPPRRLEWSYPGSLSMQCLAWYREGGTGLYLASNDTAAQRKTFAFWGTETQDILGEVTHEPEGQALECAEYRLPYHVELAAFEGDWFTAAERYRTWAREQSWSRASRLRAGLTPDWVLKTGSWVWNRGRSPGVLPPAMTLQQQLGLPVNVFWHWWHGCAYDVGFPEYFPPREGEEPFRKAVKQAGKSGVHAMVYMNQRLWGMSTASWTREGAAAYAVKGLDGEIHPETYNVFDPKPCAPMCLGTTFWRNKYAGLAEQAFDLGVGAIYMDQACLSLACFDGTHPHRPGGGNFWMAGFRELAKDIRQRAGAQRSIALAGEGCGESWLDSLDMMLSLQVSQERYAGSGDGWEVIPFFHSVYHSDATLFGSYSSLSMPPYDELWPTEFAPSEPLALLDQKFSQQFYLEQARAYVWGQQPSIANFMPRQQQERARELDYLVRIARTRSMVLEFLQKGVMLRPPLLQAPEKSVQFSRVSIYAGRRGGQTVFQKQVPLAIASAWRSPAGQTGIAVASITDDPLPITLTLDFTAHDLPEESEVECVTEAGSRPLPSLQRTKPELKIELPPRAIWFLKLRDRRS